MHHRTSLEGLAPGTQFFYRCGNPNPNLHPSDADADADAGADGAYTTGSPTLDVTAAGEGRREEGGGNRLLIGGENGGAGGVGLGVDSEGPSSSEKVPGLLRGARGGGDVAMELRDTGKWSSVLSFVTAPEAERWVVGAWRVGCSGCSLIRRCIEEGVIVLVVAKTRGGEPGRLGIRGVLIGQPQPRMFWVPGK